MTEEPPRRAKAWPPIAALLFVALFIGVYVWRVGRDIPKIQAEKRAEACRTQLRSFYTAARSYFAEFDKYDEDVSAIGFYPVDGQPAFVASATGPFAMGPPAAGDKGMLGTLSEEQVLAAIEQARAKGTVAGLEGKCPYCELVMLCISQLDEDKTYDVWSVSTAYRTRNGITIEAGELLHDVDDANE